MAKRAALKTTAPAADPAPAPAVEAPEAAAPAPEGEMPADMPADLKTEEPAAAEAAAPESQEITLHDELLDFARAFSKGFADQGANEKDEKYITRLMTAIYEAPGPTKENPDAKDEFETLSAEAQKWFDDAVAETKADKVVTLPAGFVSKFAKGGKAAAEKGKPGRPAKPAAEKVVKAKVEKAPRVGIIALSRKLLVDNFGISAEEFTKRCNEAGWKKEDGSALSINPQSLAAVYGDTTATMKLAIAAGYKKA